VKKSAAQGRIRVCLLSLHPMVLSELRRALLGSKFSLETHQVNLTVGKHNEPAADVYLVDGESSRKRIELLTSDLIRRHPNSRLLVVAEKFSEANTFPLLRLGVKGLIRYEEVVQQLQRALETVALGGFWVPRALLSRFVDSILKKSCQVQMPTLATDVSRREREVIGGLLENLSNKEIANGLNISERTVKFHVSNLLQKFGVRRRADLILLGYQVSLLGRQVRGRTLKPTILPPAR